LPLTANTVPFSVASGSCADWETLAIVPQSQGVTISAHELSQLPHDVDLGPELAALLHANG